MSAMSIQPDPDRDVIVEHLKGTVPGDERWVIFLGTSKRGELPDAARALVFARLLADLQQRRVWLRHEGTAELEEIDHGGLRGCSCC
jgi:hypothetical protein